ncbi:MAG: GTPase Era [Spirochaeta sp.]|nr:GTPase Era [Spirochaeta sp.]
MQKSGFTAIVGRPSAGKSTLLNALCEQKVSIVSNVPQTTRNKVRGIVNRDQGQMVFIDTPGYHHSSKKFNIHMVDLVRGACEEVDAVLYLVDTTRPPGEEERDMLALVAKLPRPVIVALNKIDMPSSARSEAAHFILESLPDAEVLEISAFTGEGLEELLDRLYLEMPEGEPMYPEDYYTDQDPVFRVSEIIREKAILQTKEELPHALYVEVADMEQKQEGEKNILWIRAFLIVERDSQKGIVVGHGGEKIKTIRQQAQREIGKLFPYRVHLDLRVKVHPKWRHKDALLGRLIR